MRTGLTLAPMVRHHGEADAIFLPTVLEEIPEFYMPVADRLNDTFALGSTDPRGIVLESAAVVRRLIADLGHPQDFSRHEIPESSLTKIVTAVANDQTAARDFTVRRVIPITCAVLVSKTPNLMNHPHPAETRWGHGFTGSQRWPRQPYRDRRKRFFRHCRSSGISHLLERAAPSREGSSYLVHYAVPQL
jgi:hypothetical protein